MIGFGPKRVREQIATYAPYEKLMTAEGFSRKLAENVLTIAGLDVWEAFQLFRLAKEVPDGGRIVDIGSKFGGSLISMCYGTMSVSRRVEHIGIDCSIMPELRCNTFGFPVELIEGTSEETAKKFISESVDLIFIDANHKYPYIKVDIANYWPKLKQGGVMLGHDYHEDGRKFRGVRRAAREFFGQDLSVLEHTHIFRADKSKEGKPSNGTS